CDSDGVMPFPAKCKNRPRVNATPAGGKDLRLAEAKNPYLFHSLPPNSAPPPSSSSMRRSWLYLATRSDRAVAPVLICPQLVATAISAIVASSVSPLRWLSTAV